MGPVIRNVIRDVIRPVMGDEALVRRLLLDKFTGAAAAYSLETLSVDTDNVVRVRRSSDDTEQDFNATEVDNGELVNFANNGTSRLYNERMYFDGVNDYVGFTTFGSIGIAKSFSLELSITTGSDVSTPQIIFGSANAPDDRFTIKIEAGELQTGFYDTTHRYGKSIAITAGTTLDITYTYDGAGTAVLVLNGTTATGTNLDGTMTTAGGIIGARQTSNPDTNYQGILNDLTVYSDESFTTGTFKVSGNGITNAGWTDQIGTNDGTVNGSPALYMGQGFDAFVVNETDQSGATLRTAAQATAAEQPQIVSDGTLVTDGNGNPSMIWDGVDDDLDVAAGFAGLTSANVYAVTDNAGTVSLDTLTAQDLSADTNLSTVLAGITYDKVTAVLIYPDATNQAAIEAKLADIYGITLP